MSIQLNGSKHSVTSNNEVCFSLARHQNSMIVHLPLVFTIYVFLLVCCFPMLSFRGFPSTLRHMPFGRSSRAKFSSLPFPSPRYSKALEDEYLESMKLFRKEASPKKLMKNVQAMSSSGSFTPNMTYITYRTLQKMNRLDLSAGLIPYWLKSVEDNALNNPVNVTTAVGMVKAFCRLKDMESAVKVAASVGVTTEGRTAPSVEGDSTKDAEMYQLILPELALGYISSGSPFKSLNALHSMQERDFIIDLDLSKLIFKQFLVLAKPDTILLALNVLLSLDGLQDNDSVQMITNYYFRSIDFLTGAVSIPTLPDPTVPEVCFIGRSNVGKSSLINMICNRKGVAFTSKRPGKTSEFNYFAINGVVGRDKEKHLFHMVDMPGVGFAKQGKDLRASWTALLADFVAQRSTLRVVYHLVDSRHGLLDADEECLALLETLPERTQYVIVLTKVDKQRNAEKFSNALNGIIDRIYAEVAKRTDRVVPIILTSAESKHGAANMLLHMLEAVAPTSLSSFDNVDK